MPRIRSAGPNWKTTALHATVAGLCANGLIISKAHAVLSCGPTVSTSQNQCRPNADSNMDELVINQGVTISEVDAPAMLYFNELGFTEGEDLIGSLTNNGTITSSGLGSSDFNASYFEFSTTSVTSSNAVTGIYIFGELVGALNNNGVIRATSHASNNDDVAAFGIFEAGSPAMKGTITNSGIISASSTAPGNSPSLASGIFISKDIGAGALIKNTQTGQITAIATGPGAISFGIGAGSLTGRIENAGFISAEANSNSVGGSGTAAGLQFDTITGGVIENFGTIIGTADSKVYDDTKGYSILSEDSEGSGTINNTQAGTLRGILRVRGASTNVTNAGVIDLSDGAFETVVGGNFTQTANGTLKIMAQSSGEYGYSRIVVGNTANISGTISVDVKTPHTLAAGQKLNRVVSALELTGNFTDIKDNSALFNFVSVAIEGEDGYIDLDIIKGITAFDSVSSNNNSSGLGAAGALDTIIVRGTTDPDMQRLITALGKLGTAQEVSDAVSQTTPLLTTNAALASRAAMSGINSAIETRMGVNSGMSSGDEFYGDSRLWLKPFGSRADQDDRSGVSGFDANTAGLVAGAEATSSERTRIGVAFAYAKSDVSGNSNVAPNSADIDMYQVIGYGSHSLVQDMELNFKAGIGQNTTEGKRDILLLGETAKADYDSLLASAGIGLARAFTFSDKTMFTTFLRTDYTWIKDEDYTEKGSSASLKVDSQTTDQLVFGIDGKISHEVVVGTRLVANVGVGYDVLNKRSSINSTFAGEPGIGFATRGLDTSPWCQSADLGVIHETASGMEVYLRYDTEHSKGFLNQTASVKARWDF